MLYVFQLLFLGSDLLTLTGKSRGIAVARKQDETKNGFPFRIGMGKSAMPQVQLPIFPDGVTNINSEIAFQHKDGKVCYYNGHLPVFAHDREDLATFRYFTTQLTVNGSATQSQIARAFGVPIVTVKRYVKRFHQGGAKAFFSPPVKRSGFKLNREALAKAQSLLNESLDVPEIGRVLNIFPNTIHKAISAGRLLRPDFKKKP